MILTLISISLIVLGVICTILDNFSNNKILDRIYYIMDLYLVTYIFYVFGGILGLILLVFGIVNHCGIDNRIQQNNIQYESLCKRLEIVNSDYEDVSKSDVIRDISEWNKYVVDTQYWTKNPWTNWIWSQEVADNLKLIEY